MRARIECYWAKDGWRWRLKSRNGRIQASSGQAFGSRRDARRAAVSLVRAVAGELDERGFPIELYHRAGHLEKTDHWGGDGI